MLRLASLFALIMVFGHAAAQDAIIKKANGVFTNAAGMTVYTFDKDAAGKSACNGACATNWPPLPAAAAAKPVGDLTVITRDDGTRQWTETAVVWTAYPGEQANAFWYDDGAIVVKNPDEHYVRKMVETAARLDARVQGDDGEFYGSDGLPID